ncbi:MAG TPA: HAD-IIIC family phosphatase, partial [Flavobacteriales bacterium]|nr:HAD-IIIC family phosphatase [Flavobacteriales bacterium]
RQWHKRYLVPDDSIYDKNRDIIAHIPYKNEYFSTLAALFVRHLYQIITPPKKVIVVDCDNTLWRGVLGEDGIDNIHFDDMHHQLQNKLLQLSHAGMLICLCSKNEEKDVFDVFDKHPQMKLKSSDLVATKINWQPKVQNIQDIATSLNLGLDSFIFIDDNPVECAHVRAHLPEVFTLQWPTYAIEAECLLHHTWFLDPKTATKEDKNRTQLYQDEFKRQEEVKSSLSFADFITNLQLDIQFNNIENNTVERAAQLTQRTNQFNFTTIRRNIQEIQYLCSSNDHIVQIIHVKDRFGDYGIVGLIIVQCEKKTYTLDTFLLSCRILGRGIEHKIAAHIGQLAAQKNVDNIIFPLHFSQKNKPALNFLQEIS